MDDLFDVFDDAASTSQVPGDADNQVDEDSSAAGGDKMKKMELEKTTEAKSR